MSLSLNAVSFTNEVILYWYTQVYTGIQQTDLLLPSCAFPLVHRAAHQNFETFCNGECYEHRKVGPFLAASLMIV